MNFQGTKNDDLNDSLDGLFGGPPSPDSADGTADYELLARREAALAAKRAAVGYKPMDYTEPCKKCGGSGRFRNFGPCFACKGAGKNTYKTSPEARAKARVRGAEKAHEKVVAKSDSIEAFKAEHPKVWAWLLENERKNGTPQAFQFAISLYDSLFEYGSLTEKQLAAAEKCVAAREAKRAEKVAAAPMVETAGIDRLKLAFDTAKAKAAEKGLTMKTPRLTIGGIVISPAPAHGKNPGAIYVKQGGEYLGKIADGKFYAVAACDDATKAKIMEFVADPKAAAEAYGQTTGTCCICNATLISKWKLRGIGPICAERWGW